jgi:hypothetical protein
MKWMKGFLPSMQWPFRETGSRDVRATDRSEPSDSEKLAVLTLILWVTVLSVAFMDERRLAHEHRPLYRRHD